MNPAYWPQWNTTTGIAAAALLTSLVSLWMTTRADKRAQRELRRDRVKALVQVVEILRVAEEVLPVTPSDHLKDWVTGHASELNQLADRCLAGSVVVAASFSSADGSLLAAYDELKDIAAWAIRPAESAPSIRDTLSAFARLYHLLRLLSIAAATRQALSDPDVTTTELAQDRYRKVFDGRYDIFRRERTAQIFRDPI